MSKSKSTFDQLVKKFDELEKHFDKLRHDIEQTVYNIEHAKERLEADLKQGFYFDGKNSFEIVKNRHNHSTKIKKVKSLN